MNYKWIIIISILLLVLSVATVSASDLDDNYVTESLAVDDLFEFSEIQYSNELAISPGTFDDLQVEINNALAGSVLNLTRDYNGAYGSRIQLNKDLTIDGKGHTLNCLNAEGCSAFYSSSGNIVLKNLIIINGHNDYTDNGGAIYITGSAQYTLENCIFQCNWADDYGGAIYNGVNKPLTIRDSLFELNNVDDEDGGAIYSEGEVFIENSQFYNNNAECRGGAIYATKNVHVTNSILRSNWLGDTLSDCCGGAIFTSMDVFVDGSTFRNNNAFDYGGAIYARAVTITGNDKRSVFSGNNAFDNDGGAIYAQEVIIENADFFENHAKALGGAIFSNSIINARSCEFNRNSANTTIIFKSLGGALYSIGDIVLNDCNFSNNFAGDVGGAIYSLGALYADNCLCDSNSVGLSDVYFNSAGAFYSIGDMKISNSIFANNKAIDDGGALASNSTIIVTNCRFESNTASKSRISSESNALEGRLRHKGGGAINAIQDVFVYNCTFDSNEALEYGGAIFANRVFIDTDFNHSSLFRKNSVFSSQGGAIYAESEVIAVNTIFSRNIVSHGDGGAIYSDSNADVRHCLFEYNTANISGGAIYADDDVNVDNCTFIGNYAFDSGGAIYADTITIANTPSYFINNTANICQGGAIYADKLNNDVKYAVFVNNRAGEKAQFSDDGGAIYIDDESHITFESCLFINNYCTDEGGAIYFGDYDSELSLINNIFIGNNAGDQGTAVFNFGKYVTIKNNWWGEDFIDFDNVLVECHGLSSNEDHYDVDPLRARLTIGATDMGINYTIPVQFSLISAFDEKIHPKLIGLENFIFESDHLGKFSDYYYGDNGLEASYTPKESGNHKISVNKLFNPDKELVGYVNVDNSSGRYGDTQVIGNTDLTFTHFQEMVNNAPEAFFLDLNNDFIFYGADNVLNDKNGILINKNIVINGHGHSFDAKSMSGIFQSSTGHVTLRNIVFKNGYQGNAANGGAIRILEDARYTIENCTFDSNLAKHDGGAIYNEGRDLEIWDSTFVNNRATGYRLLFDCDGGAIHSKAYTYINNCVFKNNFASDNGGAIYATGNLEISTSHPSYFEYNTANKGKGGAIYTNAFTNTVKYASFIANTAGVGAIISDDGGAIYINDENYVTFESCLFANNHCTDEGGAIYLDDADSHLNLTNNIFIGNAADEGQAVFNCGYYDLINNNFWGGNNPSSENDILIEWKNILEKNKHHSDSNPLRMDLVFDKKEYPVNNTFDGNVRFYKSNNDLFNGELSGLESVVLSSNPKMESIKKDSGVNTVHGEFTPNKLGNHYISANLFDYYVSKSISVFGIEISADEVTTFTNVPVTFKVHLDGDKQHTANQKVRVSFFKDYDLVTDANGDASITFDELNLDVGKYRVDISSNGFAGESAVNIITTIFAEDVVQIHGDHVEFKAQFTNNSGDFLKMSTQVQFLLDGNPHYSVIKDNEGNALVDFYSVSRGEHKVVVVNPDNGESKTYRIVILMGSNGNDNGTNNQNQEIPDDNNGDAVEANSLTGDLYYGNSLFDDNGVSGDNGNTTNQSANSPVSKAIDNPQTNGGDNNLWWIILAILAVLAAGGIIKKYKS